MAARRLVKIPGSTQRIRCLPRQCPIPISGHGSSVHVPWRGPLDLRNPRKTFETCSRCGLPSAFKKSKAAIIWRHFAWFPQHRRNPVISTHLGDNVYLPLSTARSIGFGGGQQGERRGQNMSARRHIVHQPILATQLKRSDLFLDGMIVPWVQPFLLIGASFSQSCWGLSTTPKVCNRTNGPKGRLMAHFRRALSYRPMAFPPHISR